MLNVNDADANVFLATIRHNLVTTVDIVAMAVGGGPYKAGQTFT